MNFPGDMCQAHLATHIYGRSPILCRRWVPGFASHCSECGADSPRIRISQFVRNFAKGNGQLADIERTVYRASSAGRRARTARKADAQDRAGVPKVPTDVR